MHATETSDWTVQATTEDDRHDGHDGPESGTDDQPHARLLQERPNEALPGEEI